VFALLSPLLLGCNFCFGISVKVQKSKVKHAGVLVGLVYRVLVELGERFWWEVGVDASLSGDFFFQE